MEKIRYVFFQTKSIKGCVTQPSKECCWNDRHIQMDNSVSYKLDFISYKLSRNYWNSSLIRLSNDQLSVMSLCHRIFGVHVCSLSNIHTITQGTFNRAPCKAHGTYPLNPLGDNVVDGKFVCPMIEGGHHGTNQSEMQHSHHQSRDTCKIPTLSTFPSKSYEPRDMKGNLEKFPYWDTSESSLCN